MELDRKRKQRVRETEMGRVKEMSCYCVDVQKIALQSVSMFFVCFKCFSANCRTAKNPDNRG